MKKIIGLSISALLLIGIVGGLTWAYFSDTANSTGNTWSAGTLTLSLVTSGASTTTDYTVTPEGGINGSVQFTNIVPGDSGSITWTLKNTGTTDGFLSFEATNTFDTELGAALMVWVTCDDADILGTTSAYVAMSGLEAALNLQTDVTMDAAQVIVYVLHWEVPTTVENEIQGESASLDITFTLNQIAAQP